MRLQWLCVLLGLWQTAAPAVLGYGGRSADIDHVLGPLVATFAMIAAWEVTRALRWVNVALSLGVVLAPWLTEPPGLRLHGAVLGAAVALFSWPRGKTKHRVGGGWTSLRTGTGEKES